MKIAIIESKASRNDYKSLFDNAFSFDLHHLCSDPSVKKVLKSNSDIDPNIADNYDYVILVGSEPTKHFTSVTAVMTYSGKLVDDKFIPVINPAMLAFKPEAKQLWESSKATILGILDGSIVSSVVDDTVAEGITDPKRCKEVLQKALEYDCDFIALDSETSALYPRDGWVLGVSLCFDGKKGYYIDSDIIDEEASDLFQQLYSSKTVVFHNAKFDLAMLEYHFNWEFPNFEDTMLLHYLINEQPGTHGLKDLVMEYTSYGDYEVPLREWIKDYCKKHGVKKADFSYEVIPFDVMYPYASVDALGTFLLYERFVKIKENPRLRWVYNNILIPGTRALVNIQDNGVPFDIDRLKTSQAIMQAEIDEAYNKLMEMPEIKRFKEDTGKEFNPNSPIQLRKVLFDYLGLPVTKLTDKKAPSTDKDVLVELSEHSDVPKQILIVRTKGKIKNTYLDKIIPNLDKDGRLRTNFNLSFTTSGRLSSSGKLNMQQIPRDDPTVKGCIAAKPGYKIVAVDLQTAEVYAAAVLSKDEALMGVFKSGEDFHSAVAKQVFGLKCAAADVKEYYPIARQAAKAVSFGIMYGASAHKISEQVTKDSGKPFTVDEAQEVINKYFSTYKGLKKWIEANKKLIKSQGFIYSHYGRKRRVPNVKSSDRGLSGTAVRSALNFLVQSVASDINFMGCIEMEQYIRTHNMDAKIFALVHDSVLAEVREDQVEEYMEQLALCLQRNRGVSIPGRPIGLDFEVGDDYSFGKYDKMYGDVS